MTNQRTFGWQIWLTLLAVILVCAGFASAVRADQADDQYAVAAGHYSQQRWTLAVSEFEKFLKEFPSHRQFNKALFYTAEAKIQLGQYAAASRQLQEYLQREPAGSLVRQAMFRAGESAYFGDQPEAAKLLQRFAATYPDDKLNAYVLVYLGDLALLAGDGPTAEKHYAGQLRQFPSGPMHGQCQLGVARALSAQGKRSEAIRSLTEPTENSTDPSAAEARAYLASLHYAAGDFAAALADCEKLAPQPTHPRFAQVALLRGESLYQLGRYDDAKSQFEKLLATQTTAKLSAEVKLWLGLTQKAQQKYAEAAELLQTAAKSHADLPLAATLRFHAADCQVRAGQFAAAEQLLRIDSSPTGDAAEKDAPLHQMRGYLLAVALQGQKQHAEALEQLDRITGVKDASLQGDVLLARTISLSALDRGAEAIEPLARFVQSQTTSAVIRPAAELTVLLAKNKRIDEARAALAHFQQLKPNAELQEATTRRVADAAYQAGEFKWSQELFATLSGGKPSPVAAPKAANDRAPETATASNDKKDASGVNSKAADALNGLAWSQFRADDFITAAETFGKLIDDFPDDSRAAEFAWMQGQSLQRAGKIEPALAAFLQLLEKHNASPQTPQAMLAAARLHEQLHQSNEALALYERLTRDYSDAPEMEAGLLNWAWALSDLNRADEAQRLFARLRHDFPQGHYWADATLRLAELQLADKHFVTANKLTDELLASKPGDDLTQRSLYLQGQIAAAAEQWDQIAAPLARLIAAYPDSSLRLAAEYWLAEAAYRQKKFEEAGLQFAALAKRTAGRHDSWLAMVPLRQAQVLAQGHQWSEARELAEKIHADYPDFAQQYEADYLIGRCYAADADFDKARQAYSQVLRSASGGKSETAAMAQWMIGESYFHQQNYDSAIREYLRLEILYPFPHWQAGGLLQAGKCHEALGQWKSAAEMYTRLLKNYPQTEFTEEAGRHLQLAQQHSEPQHK